MNPQTNKKLLALACVAGALVTLDQLTKVYVHTHFHLGESVQVIPDFFNLTYVRNPGGAFGMFAQSPHTWREWIFFLIAPLAMVFIGWQLLYVNPRNRLLIFSWSCIFGGALGNYIDRLRFGYVVDFLDFYIKSSHWPAFNIADMAIVVGLAMIFMLPRNEDLVDPVSQTNPTGPTSTNHTTTSNQESPAP